jgi:hypothetical protein
MSRKLRVVHAAVKWPKGQGVENVALSSVDAIQFFLLPFACKVDAAQRKHACADALCRYAQWAR